MRVIDEIGHKVNQGYSNPYECRVDGEAYIIKGLPRSSQVNEWICANLASKFGLPIVEFEILYLPEELFDILDDDAKQHLGCGPVFGTKFIESAMWFEPNAMNTSISNHEKVKIFLFDYWVRNSDRNSGNTNLLFCDKKVKVIDHNEAFRVDYTFEDLYNHLFYEHIDINEFNDLVFRSNTEKQFEEILNDYDKIVEKIPEEWGYLDPPDFTVPSKVNFEWIEKTLRRYDDKTFWSFI